MGFNFDMEQLTTGGLFHGTLSGLNSGTLEITNNATATHQASTIPVGNLIVGSASGSGTYTLGGTGQLTVAGRRTSATTARERLRTRVPSDTSFVNLYLGCGTGDHGTYSLSSMGQLWAGAEFLRASSVRGLSRRPAAATRSPTNSSRL